MGIRGLFGIRCTPTARRVVAARGQKKPGVKPGFQEEAKE
jgi:hypothetical protein